MKPCYTQSFIENLEAIMMKKNFCLLVLSLYSLHADASADLELKISGGRNISFAKTADNEQVNDLFAGSKSKGWNIQISLGYRIKPRLPLNLVYSQHNIITRKTPKDNSKIVELLDSLKEENLIEKNYQDFIKEHGKGTITFEQSMENTRNILADEQYKNDINNYKERLNFANNLLKQAQTKVRSQALMVEANYEFGEHPRLVPYLLAGIGGVFHQLGDFNYADGLGNTASINGKQKFNMAYSVGVGLKMPINDNIAFDLSGFYYNHGKIKSNTELTTAFNSETDQEQIGPLKMHGFKFLVGVRFSF